MGNKHVAKHSFVGNVLIDTETVGKLEVKKGETFELLAINEVMGTYLIGYQKQMLEVDQKNVDLN